MAEKVLSISALAKEVYMQHVGGGTVPANMLPLVEQNAPKFPSSWAGNCCSSMTLALHFGILGALFKKISLVDDQRRPLEQFAVVEVFSGVQGKEHIWNVVRFAGDESWYSIDLSIEQYKEQQVSDPANKPWNLFPSSEGSYPYKEAGAVTDIATTHPLLPKVRCDASDAANFGVYWRVALEAVKTGFELKETDEDGQEVIVPVSADLVQAVTSKVSAVLRRLPDLK